MTGRIRIALAVAALPLLGLCGASLAGAAGGQPQSTDRVRLAEASLIVEVNATDGDAGLQVFLDGDPWNSIEMSSPDGRKMLDIDAVGRLKNFGLTELFSESNEPPFEEFPLEKFKELFPEGTYRFAGTTIEGERVMGRAKLSHDIPDGPKITSPKDGDEVPRDRLVVRWEPAPEPPGIEILGYRAILAAEAEPLLEFSVELPTDSTKVTVPPEVLKSGVEYKLEVQAIEKSGNQTLTEITFSVK